MSELDKILHKLSQEIGIDYVDYWKLTLIRDAMEKYAAVMVLDSKVRDEIFKD